MLLASPNDAAGLHVRFDFHVVFTPIRMSFACSDTVLRARLRPKAVGSHPNCVQVLLEYCN